MIDWLLSGEVQVRQGPEAGGVLGWFDHAGTERFLYPEVTGYYLTFLSFLQAHGWQADIEHPACLAAGWLARICGGQMPPATRIYCEPVAHDWRNDFWFSFDLAMMWRGMTLGARNGTAIERHLARFCPVDDTLLASLPCTAGADSKAWSVQRGPFQMKTAAALLYSGGKLRHEVKRSAEATVERYREWLPEECSRELMHPYLYFVEGALLAGVAAGDETLLRQAAAALQRIDDRTDELRSDVLAQTLRCGCLLHAGGYLPDAWAVRLPKAAAALAERCAPDGRVYFQGTHVNIWSGLFAAQALIWYNQWLRRALRIDAALWLV